MPNEERLKPMPFEGVAIMRESVDLARSDIRLTKNDPEQSGTPNRISGNDMKPMMPLSSKPCTKTRGCTGTMTWTPQFKEMGPKGGPPYRPAWVCDKCGKHDYVKGE